MARKRYLGLGLGLGIFFGLTSWTRARTCTVSCHRGRFLNIEFFFGFTCGYCLHFSGRKLEHARLLRINILHAYEIARVKNNLIHVRALQYI